MKNKLITLLVLNFLLASCNELLYETPMPLNSELISEFPNSFMGEYLQIHFEENEVAGFFKSITKIADGRYLIESTEVVFLDSLTLASQNMSSIKRVQVKNDHLEIITEDNTYKRAFADTLSSLAKEKEYEIDLKEGIFYNSFNSEGDYEGSGKPCQLRINKGKYYLNIEYFDKYWAITRIVSDRKKLSINTNNFSTSEEKKLEFEQLKSTYGFERIVLERHRQGNWDYYLAKSDNKEMNRLLDEEFFTALTWHRINDTSRIWMTLPVGILILLGLLFYFWRIKKVK